MHREILTLSTVLFAAGCASGGGAKPEDPAHMNAMAREHAGHTPVANASAAEPRVQVTGEEVAYGTVGGRPVRGYMAYPTTQGANAALPGVLMIHEWWGLNATLEFFRRHLRS